MTKELMQQALDALYEYEYAKTDKADLMVLNTIQTLEEAIAHLTNRTVAHPDGAVVPAGWTLIPSQRSEELHALESVQPVITDGDIVRIYKKSTGLEIFHNEIGFARALLAFNNTKEK